MRFNTIRFFLAVCILMMSGCSEHTPDKHEQLYLDTVDSLKLYQGAPYLQKELAGNEKARDFLTLNYEDFKTKHNWNDEEMDVFSGIIQGHVNIAKTLQKFNPNTQ